jgi:hypothetical protein
MCVLVWPFLSQHKIWITVLLLWFRILLLRKKETGVTDIYPSCWLRCPTEFCSGWFCTYKDRRTEVPKAQKALVWCPSLTQQSLRNALNTEAAAPSLPPRDTAFYSRAFKCQYQLGQVYRLFPWPTPNLRVKVIGGKGGRGREIMANPSLTIRYCLFFMY